MQDGLDRAALGGVEVGNMFGDDDAFSAMNADHPWVKVGIIVASSLETFNSALYCTTVFGPVVGAVGECDGVQGRHEKNLTRAL